MLPENILQSYPESLLLTNNFVISHYSLRMDEHYYNVIYGFLLTKRSIMYVSNKRIMCSKLVRLIFPMHLRYLRDTRYMTNISAIT